MGALAAESGWPWGVGESLAHITASDGLSSGSLNDLWAADVPITPLIPASSFDPVSLIAELYLLNESAPLSSTGYPAMWTKAVPVSNDTLYIPLRQYTQAMVSGAVLPIPVGDYETGVLLPVSSVSWSIVGWPSPGMLVGDTPGSAHNISVVTLSVVLTLPPGQLLAGYVYSVSSVITVNAMYTNDLPLPHIEYEAAFVAAAAAATHGSASSPGAGTAVRSAEASAALRSPSGAVYSEPLQTQFVAAQAALGVLTPAPPSQRALTASALAFSSRSGGGTLEVVGGVGRGALLYVSAPPFGGELSVAPLTGRQLVTPFSLSTAGWVDNDAAFLSGVGLAGTLLARYFATSLPLPPNALSALYAAVTSDAGAPPATVGDCPYVAPSTVPLGSRAVAPDWYYMQVLVGNALGVPTQLVCDGILVGANDTMAGAAFADPGAVTWVLPSTSSALTVTFKLDTSGAPSPYLDPRHAVLDAFAAQASIESLRVSSSWPGSALAAASNKTELAATLVGKNASAECNLTLYVFVSNAGGAVGSSSLTITLAPALDAAQAATAEGRELFLLEVLDKLDPSTFSTNPFNAIQTLNALTGFSSPGSPNATCDAGSNTTSTSANLMSGLSAAASALRANSALGNSSGGGGGSSSSSSAPAVDDGTLDGFSDALASLSSNPDSLAACQVGLIASSLTAMLQAALLPPVSSTSLLAPGTPVSAFPASAAQNAMNSIASGLAASSTNALAHLQATLTILGAAALRASVAGSTPTSLTTGRGCSGIALVAGRVSTNPAFAAPATLGGVSTAVGCGGNSSARRLQSDGASPSVVFPASVLAGAGDGSTSVDVHLVQYNTPPYNQTAGWGASNRTGSNGSSSPVVGRRRSLHEAAAAPNLLEGEGLNSAVLTIGLVTADGKPIPVTNSGELILINLPLSTPATMVDGQVAVLPLEPAAVINITCPLVDAAVGDAINATNIENLEPVLAYITGIFNGTVSAPAERRMRGLGGRVFISPPPVRSRSLGQHAVAALEALGALPQGSGVASSDPSSLVVRDGRLMQLVPKPKAWRWVMWYACAWLSCPHPPSHPDDPSDQYSHTAEVFTGVWVDGEDGTWVGGAVRNLQANSSAPTPVPTMNGTSFEVTLDCGPVVGDASLTCGPGSAGNVYTFTCPIVEFTASCAYWSESLAEWSTEGCEVVSVSLEGVVCGCTHLGESVEGVEGVEGEGEPGVGSFSDRFSAMVVAQQVIFDEFINPDTFLLLFSETPIVVSIVGVLLAVVFFAICCGCVVDQSASTVFFQGLRGDHELKLLRRIVRVKGHSWMLDRFFDAPPVLLNLVCCRPPHAVVDVPPHPLLERPAFVRRMRAEAAAHAKEIQLESLAAAQAELDGAALPDTGRSWFACCGFAGAAAAPGAVLSLTLYSRLVYPPPLRSPFSICGADCVVSHHPAPQPLFQTCRPV